jgi:hypothetical protein
MWYHSSPVVFPPAADSSECVGQSCCWWDSLRISCLHSSSSTNLSCHTICRVFEHHDLSQNQNISGTSSRKPRVRIHCVPLKEYYRLSPDLGCSEDAGTRVKLFGGNVFFLWSIENQTKNITRRDLCIVKLMAHWVKLGDGFLCTLWNLVSVGLSKEIYI